MLSAKISPQLADSLRERDNGESLDVVIELTPPDPLEGGGPSSTEPIAAKKATFAKHADPVAAMIRRLGGEVTGLAWINGSLSARVAKTVVPALSNEAFVARLDLPRTIQSDVKPSK